MVILQIEVDILKRFVVSFQPILNNLKKSRNRAQRKWLSDQSNPELTREYKISQTKYRSAVQKAKRKSFENFIEEINIHQNPKKAWKNINAMKGNIQNTKIDHLIVNDNKTVTDDKNSEILANQYHYVSSNNNINPKLEVKINQFFNDDFGYPNMNVNVDFGYPNLNVNVNVNETFINGSRPSQPVIVIQRGRNVGE